MTQTLPLYVPHTTSQAGDLEVTAPFDGAELASIAAADSGTVDQALSTALNLFQNRASWLPAAQRIEILNKTAKLMEAQFEALAHGAAQEGGKPLLDSRVEVARAIDGVKSCVELMRTESGREIPMNLNAASAGRIAVTQKEPIGVVVAVSAFNHPLNLIIHQVGPAIASGCPVIIKPAEDTPLSCFRFVDLLREAGLPEEWCQPLVVKDLEVASQLVTDPRVSFFSFIGSAKVGWMLRSQLAPGARCALEHGGAAPVIVMEDADMADALPLLAKGGFYHAGQVCVSVQRVFAHESLARDLAEQLAAQAKQLKIGDPTAEDTDVGPLIRHREVDRVDEWVQAALAEGTESLSGAKKLSESCYDCTVLYDPPASAQVSQLEIFGPVICVYPYRDLDEAIQRANSLPYAFQAAVFTQDIDRALYASERLAASAVMINDHSAFRVDWMPFAGLKQSGLGVGGIPYTYHDMQIEKMTVIRKKTPRT